MPPPRPPDLDADGNPIGSARPPDLDAAGQPIMASATRPPDLDASGNPIAAAAGEDPNTVGTFARHVGAQVNPIPAGQLLPFPKAAGGAGWDAPWQAVKALGRAQGEPFDRAKASLAEGDYTSAAIHGFHYLLPGIGPVLDRAGVDLKEGKYAAGLGDTVGLGAALTAGHTVPAAGRLVKDTVGPAVADWADKAANTRIGKVISPQLGPNKVRFGREAQKVAPRIARETTGLSREGVADSVAGKLDDATSALDAAADARLHAQTFDTQPIIDALQEARDRRTAQSVEGSRPIPSLVGEGGQVGIPGRPLKVEARPLGNDVVPAPNAARVAAIDQAIAEVKALGPSARYEALRRIREAWDGPAKAVYSPSMTADYLKAQGGKFGAADVTGTLRDYLGKIDPETAAANTDYADWKRASDVLTATEETERVRPTVGRTMLARGLGAMAGGAAGGGLGAAAGALVAPTIEQIAAGIRPARMLATARGLAKLADTIRARGGVADAAQMMKIRAAILARITAQPSQQEAKAKAR